MSVLPTVPNSPSNSATYSPSHSTTYPALYTAPTKPSYASLRKKYAQNKPKRNDSRVIRSSVDHLLNMSILPQRGGVIPYTINNNQIYFCFGIDTKSGQLTDFGGGIAYSKDNNAVSGALREFREETLCSFGDTTLNDIHYCPVIYDRFNLVIFLYCIVDHKDIINKFDDKVLSFSSKTSKKQPEISNIVWCSTDEYKTIIDKKGVMYDRLRRFLRRAGNIGAFL